MVALDRGAFTVTEADGTYRLDVNTLHRDSGADRLALNEIGRVWLHLREPMMFDAYSRNRETGSFILVDEGTNQTVAAGMINGPHMHNANIVWQTTKVGRDQRTHLGATLWMTGLSGSGKSSLAIELERRLIASGRPAYILDGDNLRHGLNADLGFSALDRQENIRRAAQVAALFADAGMVVIVAMISPFAADRAIAREIHEDQALEFHEIFVDTPGVGQGALFGGWFTYDVAPAGTAWPSPLTALSDWTCLMTTKPTTATIATTAATAAITILFAPLPAPEEAAAWILAWRSLPAGWGFFFWAIGGFLWGVSIGKVSDCRVDVGQVLGCLCRTPAASSAVRDRNASRPSDSSLASARHRTKADPTITPSA